VHSIDGYTFVVEQDLIKSAGGIKVDMTPYGFAVSSTVSMGGGGGGCSGSCSSC